MKDKFIMIGMNGSGKTTFMERGLALLNKTKGYSVSYPGKSFIESLRKNKEFNKLSSRAGTKGEPIVEATIKRGLIRGEKYQISIRDMAGDRTTSYKESLIDEIKQESPIVVACIDSSNYPQKEDQDTLDIVKEVQDTTSCVILLTKIDEQTAETVNKIFQDLRKELGQKIRIKKVNNFQSGETYDNPSIVLRDILGI